MACVVFAVFAVIGFSYNARRLESTENNNKGRTAWCEVFNGYRPCEESEIGSRETPVGGDQTLSNTSTTFNISQESIGRRKKNVLLGGMFSLVLAGIIVVGNYRYPETYNDVLLWSVLGFVVLANLVNYYRHSRYLRLIRDHRLEVVPGRVQFWTSGEKSELELENVAGMFLYRKKNALQHIQIRLKNNRGIRLEGYRDMERLAQLIAEQLPKEHVVDKKA